MKVNQTPKSPWAKVLKSIGIIIFIILVVIGGIGGYFWGLTCPFGSGDDITESIITSIIGIFLGGIVGILIIALIMYFSELGENTRKTAQNTYNNNSSADELKKYKELLDNGVITEEEFIAKKNKILNQ